MAQTKPGAEEELALALKVESAEAELAIAVGRAASAVPAIVALESALGRSRSALRELFREGLGTAEEARAKRAALRAAIQAARRCGCTPHERARLADGLADLRLHRRTLDALAGALDRGDPSVPRVERAMHVADRARGALVATALPLARSVARRYRRRGVDLDDLVQEATIGLMRAVDKFDPRRGIRFRAYAKWWARQQVQRALVDHAQTIRVPLGVAQAELSLRAARRVFRTLHGREPGDAELVAAKRIDLEVVTLASASIPQPLSLDAPLEGGGDLIERVPDLSIAPLEEALVFEELRAEVQSVVSALPFRQGQVVRWRFGLDGARAQTLQEVSARLGLSCERVRRIESAALRRLSDARALRALFARREPSLPWSESRRVRAPWDSRQSERATADSLCVCAYPASSR